MINGSPRRHQARTPPSRQRSSRKDDISGEKADIESITVIASAIKQLQILKHSSSRSVIGTRNCFLSVWCALELPRAPPGRRLLPGPHNVLAADVVQLVYACHSGALPPRARGGCQAGGGCRLPRRFLWPRPHPSLSGDRATPMQTWPPRGSPVSGDGRASETRALLQREAGCGPSVLRGLRARLQGSRGGQLLAALTPSCPQTVGRASLTPVVGGVGEGGVAGRTPACPDQGPALVAFGGTCLTVRGRGSLVPPGSPGEVIQAHSAQCTTFFFLSFNSN